MKKHFKLHQLSGLFLGLVVLFYCCKSDNNLELKHISQQVFETDFVPSSRFSGVFEEKRTNREYIYLANGRTEKKVSFFTTDGEHIKTIDFKKATYFFLSKFLLFLCHSSILF